MRTDTIFYQLFQTFPSLLFELLGDSPQQANHYQFSSREIKELARRFDGIFLPTQNDMDLPIYFVEVQFQPKTDFYWRFLAEIFVYLGQYQPIQDWLAIAIFSSRHLDPGLPLQYRGLVASSQIQWVYLDELVGLTSPSLSLSVVQLVVGTEQFVQQKAKPLLERATQELTDVALQQKVIELIERILLYKFTHLTRAELETMFSLNDLKQTRFYEEVKEEVEEKAKEEGKLETIPRFLALGLSVEQIAQALGLDVARVQQIADELSEN